MQQIETAPLRPPWVELQGNKVFKNLGLKEDGLVTVNVVQMTPCINELREVVRWARYVSQLLPLLA
jgi:hypothetical protein